MSNFALEDDPRARDITDEFSFLDSWEDRYRHVIDLGRALAPLSPEEHCSANKISGCVSQVWLVSECAPGSAANAGPVLRFRADSDAHIVRGLAALLIRLYSNRPASEIVALNASALFDAIDLAGNLSAQRANGLTAMIDRIQTTARAAFTVV